MKQLFAVLLVAALVTGCAQHRCQNKVKPGRTAKVRTTAYTAHEPGGARNALGSRLKTGPVTSAAADWSRFPVGTKFEIVGLGKVYEIDDYGSALVGTNTIDLFKTSNRDMRNWGVRYVDIRILEWGSPQRSLEILAPRSGNRHVRPMVLALREQVKTEG